MRCGIDEVGRGNHAGGKTDYGTVQRNDQDLRMRIERPGEVKIVYDEGTGEIASFAGAEYGVGGTGDICASTYGISAAVVIFRARMNCTEGEIN